MSEEIRKMIDKVKTFNQFIKEEYEHKDTEESYFSSWIDEKDYDSKKKRFVWDAKETLTGFFGTIGVKNEQQIMKRLGQIFDHAMSKTYEHGISFLKDNWEHRSQLNTISKYLNTNDVDLVYDLIDGVFNQD